MKTQDWPIREWVRECEDAWLKDLLAFYVETELPWCLFVATGLMAVLRPLPHNKQDIFTDLLAGKMFAEPERDWAKGLDEKTRKQLRARFHGAVEGLHLRLMDTSPLSSEGFLRILHSRDDIQAGLMLLGDRENQLWPHLQNIDVLLIKIMKEYPAELFEEDERWCRSPFLHYLAALAI